MVLIYPLPMGPDHSLSKKYSDILKLNKEVCLLVVRK